MNNYHLKVIENNNFSEDKVLIKEKEIFFLSYENNRNISAKLTIAYSPNKWLIDENALDRYLIKFKEKPFYVEMLVNIILDDIVNTLSPFDCEVTCILTMKNGLSLETKVKHKI